MDAFLPALRPSLALCLALLCACGGNGGGPAEGSAASAADAEGELVTPPFSVTGDCDGLFLYYMDEDGVHAVEHRSDVPEVARDRVRVESPRLGPGDRLDPDSVYIADLRQAGADGNYAVRRLPRDTFDAWVDHATGHDQVEQVAMAGDPVIIYGAPWCGACRALEGYLDSIGVPHIDKDIESDASARAEMQQKTRAAGVQATGIPVVDIDGTILQGFDRGRVDQLLARRQAGAPTAPSAPTPAPGTVPI
ncbi:MAG: hypothetical protein GXP55_05825 [Deltaproteobacteria bacterium]|nr:hypothetical protein [Deltaproteobacteria bacterium]